MEMPLPFSKLMTPERIIVPETVVPGLTFHRD